MPRAAFSGRYKLCGMPHNIISLVFEGEFRLRKGWTAEFIKYFILFGIGGIAYVVIELLWRGYSHWSMFVLGGLCFLLIGRLNEHFGTRLPLPALMLLGSAAVTLLEFAAGYLLNIRLGLHVWSYYGEPYNLMGQVCLKYTLMWFFMSGVCIAADNFLRRALFA